MESPNPVHAGGKLIPFNNTSSYDYYDKLYSHLVDTQFNYSARVGIVEVLAGTSNPLKTGREFAFLPVTTLLGFAYKALDDEGRPTLKTYGSSNYKGLAAFLMGIHHFNNGDGRVVKEVERINETCNVRLVTDIYDSEFDQVTALSTFTELMDRGGRDRPISVLFGASSSSKTVPLSVMTSIHQIPQFSPLSTSTELDDKHQYQYFSRLIPSDAGTALAALTFFRDRLKARHIGVFYVNDVYGTSYFKAVKEHARHMDIVTRGFSFSTSLASDQDHSEIRYELQNLKKTGYRAFFGVFFDKHYKIVMTEAVKLDIAGEGYTWIFADGINESSLKQLSREKGSHLAIGTQGIGILKPVGGRASDPGDSPSGFDRFLDAWWSQTDEAVAYYNSKNPKNNSMNNAEELYHRAPPGTFYPNRVLQPSSGGSFGYDTMIAIGLAACAVIEQNKLDGTPDTYYVTGPQLFDQFTKSDFEGASGRINIDSQTYSRDPSTASFVLHNAFVAKEEGDNVIFDIRPALYTSRKEDGTMRWTNVKGISFLHSDNTTFAPDAKPIVENEEFNYLGDVRPVGFLLACTLIVLSLTFAIWSYQHRNVRVVRASQPIFLITISLGTLVMSASILPMSIDDEIASIELNDAACVAVPWLFTLGFTITYSGLFSKIWRINKIFHNPAFRRIKVTEADVLVPFVILFSANIILLFIWTFVDPMHWKRVYIGTTDEYGRNWNSIGFCVLGDTHIAIVLGVLVLTVNVTALLLANFQAYRARNIKLEYSESKYIAIAMACVLEANLFGIPIIFLVKDNPRASFFARSLLVFVISLATLLLIFVPKVIHFRRFMAAKTPIEDERRWNMALDSFRKLMTARLHGGNNSPDDVEAPRRKSRPSMSRDDDVQQSSGAEGLRILNHPENVNEELLSLKSRLSQYVTATEMLAQSLEEKGVDIKSISECLPSSLERTLSSVESMGDKNHIMDGHIECSGASDTKWHT